MTPAIDTDTRGERRSEHVSPRLEVDGVTKRFEYGGTSLEVLDEVSLTVPAGSFVTLLGPSGCGKSTLLEIIAGLAAADEGRVRLDGQIVHAPGFAGYMPQRDLLLPWRTLLSNITLGPEVRGRSTRETRDEAIELLARFGLHGFEDARPDQLSGGMRQRAALLRAVMYESRFLVLDEPLSALDALTRIELQGWLGDLVKTLRSTVVMVTHDVREALRLSDIVYVLEGRPARIVNELHLPDDRPRTAADLTMPDFIRAERDLLDALHVSV